MHLQLHDDTNLSSLRSLFVRRSFAPAPVPVLLRLYAPLAAVGWGAKT
jgi:hypothetical protein